MSFVVPIGVGLVPMTLQKSSSNSHGETKVDRTTPGLHRQDRAHQFSPIAPAVRPISILASPPSRNRDINSHIKAVDKALDDLLTKVLLRGPRGNITSIRPKLNGGRSPHNVGSDSQHRSASVVYVPPSWRKKLDGQFHNHVCEATKFHP